MNEELSQKLARVRSWLAATGFGAALFTSQPGVAWVTGGLEDRVVRNEEPGLAWALVTPAEAHLITTTIEATRLVAEADLAGFTLHAVAWHDQGGLASAAQRLAGSDGGLAGGGRWLATDGAGPGTLVPGELAALRLPHTAAEHQRLAALGADTATALEGALRQWTPGERECDLAARIAAALEERLVFPAVLLVGGARRRRAFRHPVPTTAVTGPDVLAVVTGGRGGLTVSCSRSAAAGQPDPELAVRHQAATVVEAALIAATRPGRSWAQALAAGQAAYADAGFPGEWREHVQGGPVGYLSREFDVVPGTASAETVIAPGTAFAWNPTVRGAKSEDTFILPLIIGATGTVIPVTNTPDWPVTPGGRPDILRV
jgi:Xaa-Pro aminopeptidase